MNKDSPIVCIPAHVNLTLRLVLSLTLLDDMALVNTSYISGINPLHERGGDARRLA